MRKVLAGCLGLSLSLCGSLARGGDADPRSPKGRVVIAQSERGTGGRPQAITLGRPQPITLGKPEPIPPSDSASGELRPVGYVAPEVVTPSLFRAQSSEEAPQKLPMGTPVDVEPPTTTDGPVKILTTKPTEIRPQPGQPIPMGGPVVMSDGSGGACSSCCEGSSLFGCGLDCCEENECMPRWFWTSAEYILWNVKQGNLPPLVTSSSPASRGILGNPDTVILYGGPANDTVDRSGGRVTLGFWLERSHTIGLEGSFLFIGERNQNFFASSSGFPLLARPFFDVNTGMQNSELIADPNNLAGHVKINTNSRLWGAEINARTNICCNCDWKVDLLGGVRYAELDDTLGVTEVLGVLPGAQGLAGSGFLVSDGFTTRNFFYGGQFGTQAECNWRRWFLNLSGKVALGCTHELATVNGMTTFVVPGTSPRYREGGLLALPSNIGTYSRNEFAVLPEFGVKIGYHVLPRLRLFVGYNILYWSQVARAGDQIDTVINRTQIPSIFANGMLVGPPRPQFAFRGTDFWAQGVTFGIEFQF